MRLLITRVPRLNPGRLTNEINQLSNSGFGMETMLRAAGRSFYVGEDRPDWPDFIHLPDGNIDVIPQELLRGY